MKPSEIIGNSDIKKYLQRIVMSNRIGNSLLFSGPDGVGKGLFALELATMLLGEENRERIFHRNHPDVRELRPEGKVAMHSMDALRSFISDVNLAPFEAKRKVFILLSADRMLPTSSNALLKTFEEPPQDTIIILLTSSPELLLPTILSRCSKISFKPVPEMELVAWLQNHHQVSSEKEACKVARLSKGSPGMAFKLLSEGENTMRAKLLNALCRAPFAHYGELKECVDSLTAEIDRIKKENEESVRATLVEAYQSDASAAQKAAVEQEVQGMASIQSMHEIEAFFKHFLSWFRDLHLLQLNGNRALLMNPDFEPELATVAQRGNLADLEVIQQSIKEARTSIQRFTSVPAVLEALFLKTGVF